MNLKDLNILDYIPQTLRWSSESSELVALVKVLIKASAEQINLTIDLNKNKLMETE